MIGERKLLARLDQMLEDGINGTFAESDYDESRLSRLESRWLQYLTASKLSRQNVEREREKLKELVSDISHQTKTPLANILLYTQLLEEQELDAQSRQLAEEIRAQAEKLEFLIQSLVKTSRLETGTFQLTPEVNNVEELVCAAAEQAAARAEEKGIQIRILPMEEAVGVETGDYGEIVKLEEQSTAASSGSAVESEVPGMDIGVSSGTKAASCTARFDRKWTCEALFNILDNAIKYSPENSTVSIGIDSYEMFRCVCVADQGVGIAEEELPKIFGRFYRGQNVRQESGVGIGLYLSRQIVEGQGGYIQAESEPGNMKLSGAALERMEAFLEKYAETDQRGAFQEAAEGCVHADIYGIDADLLDELEILSGNVDPQGFAAGGYAIAYTRYVRTEEGDEALDDLYKPGDPVTIELTDGTSKTYEVMAVGVMPGALNTSRVSAFHGELMLPHSEYFALTDNRNPMNVMIRAEDGMYDAVAEQIGYMTGASDNCIVKGREDYVAEYKDLANMFRLIGGALCGILALIGILNFVNAVATGVLSRRREFAMMSAVGMKGRQLEGMLMWEGAFYAGLAAVCSAALGAAVSALVLRRIMGGIMIFSYHFTILPVLVCSIILAALSIVIPTAAYRAICRESVVERLRTAE